MNSESKSGSPPTPTRALRVLHLEDSDEDRELVQLALHGEGIQCEYVYAASRAEFQAALEYGEFDLILSDFTLPGYDGSSALAWAQEWRPNIPYLFVSGTIGEERAVESLKCGATDYVLKDHLEHLGPAVRRALREAGERAERQRVEEQLAYERSLLRALLDNVPDSIYFKDADSRYLMCSAALAKQLGLKHPEEAVGRTDFNFHPADRAAENFAEEQRVIAEGRPLINKIESLVDREGRKRWMAVTKVPIHPDQRGQAARLIGISRDITSLKQIEEALCKSEARYRGLVESAQDAIFLLAPDGKILSANPAVQALVGWAQRDCVGKPFIALLHPEDRERAREFLEHITPGEKAPTVELRVATAAGGEVPLEFTLTPQLVAGKVASLLGIGRDVTERRRLQAQILQMQRMESIGRLAGGIAHDFNNILSIIQCHTWQLQGLPDLAPGAADSVRQISHAAERAANLTRQLLLFSKQQMFQPCNLDLGEVLKDLTKMLRRVLGEDVTLTVNTSATPTVVRADRGMMEQVVMNLTLNSRDALATGGKLDITTELVTLEAAEVPADSKSVAGRFVCLTVADTGWGIPAEHLSRIFEPFFTTKEVGKGTGLGLATVHGIVAQLQGWVLVSSEVGQGTTIRVFLPALDATAETPSAPVMEMRSRGGAETILVVEDEPALQALVVHLLEEQGYAVLAAASGVEALALWEQRRDEIDLLLTDLVLPHGMNGRELAARLHQDESHLKVIFTSGYSTELAPGNLSTETNFTFLQKPYHPRELVNIVRGTLDEAAA